MHESVRLGDTAAAQAIAEVLEEVDCTAGRAALAHGRALSDRDAAALDAAAAQLEELGMACAAADAGVGTGAGSEAAAVVAAGSGACSDSFSGRESVFSAVSSACLVITIRLMRRLIGLSG